MPMHFWCDAHATLVIVVQPVITAQKTPTATVKNLLPVKLTSHSSSETKFLWSLLLRDQPTWTKPYNNDPCMRALERPHTRTQNILRRKLHITRAHRPRVLDDVVELEPRVVDAPPDGVGEGVQRLDGVV